MSAKPSAVADLSTVVHFQAAKPNHVALTFDDGPDSKWTPQILDIL
jgi:peptidoglycan/xylan/chitin deacetylase (PgdA/CDA1 family)